MDGYAREKEIEFLQTDLTPRWKPQDLSGAPIGPKVAIMVKALATRIPPQIHQVYKILRLL
jgi:hypothetical protein